VTSVPYHLAAPETLRSAHDGAPSSPEVR
jgi:hypothetical protein